MALQEGTRIKPPWMRWWSVLGIFALGISVVWSGCASSSSADKEPDELTELSDEGGLLATGSGRPIPDKQGEDRILRRALEPQIKPFNF